MIAKIKRNFNRYLAKNGTDINSLNCVWYIKIVGIWLYSPSLYSCYRAQYTIKGLINGIENK